FNQVIYSSIRLWALTGEVLLEMVCHTAIVYSVDAHKSSGLVASGSEDGSAKIWKGDISCPLHKGYCYWLYLYKKIDIF
ncbi:phospholipase A2-activating protein, partial [Tanacetum coccineum]